MIELNANDKEHLKYIIKNHGQPTISQAVPAETIAYWQDKLPNRLLVFWQELGWYHFSDGLLWLVNPSDYSGMVDMWLQGTKYADIDTFHCIARTAFGEMLVYAENNNRTMKIMPQHATIWVDDKKIIRPQKCGNSLIAAILTFSNDESFDLTDINDKGLYQQALQKLGKLADDEMYAYEPFMLLLPDEKHTVEHLAKVRMDAQLYLLRETFDIVSRGTSYSDIYN